MRIHTDQQDSVYTQYWQPMQELLGDNLTEFIRHYLTRTGVVVNQSDVYFEIKERIGTSDALPYLRDLCVFSEYYSRLLNPEREPSNVVRKYLHRIKRLELATVYPFLLNCYDDWIQEKTTEREFISTLQIIENFILRRFVCNVQTRGLNRIFASLYSQISRTIDLASDSFVERLKLKLQDQSYPKDVEFRARLVDVKLYGSNRSEKCKLILESIEEFGHRENVDPSVLTIEHIMPQTLSDQWKTDLGEDWEITHELLRHTLGNLTLTAYNSELSNATFEVKKNRLQESNLRLNNYFQTKESWTREDIEERAAYLADIALQIWSYFGDSSTQSAQLSPTRNSPTGRTPRILYLFGQEHPVRSWRDVLEVTLNTIAELEPEYFQEIMQQFPRFISWDANDLRQNRSLRNGAFIEVQLSAQDIYRFCQKAIEIVGLSAEEWRVETQEPR